MFKTDIEEVTGTLLHYFCLFTPIVGMLYALGLVASNGIYGYVYFPGFTSPLIHSWSLFCVLGVFWVVYAITSYLYPLVRMIVALSFMVFSIQSYDFLWSAFSQAARGEGYSWPALVACAVLLVLLERMDNRHCFAKPPSFPTSRFLICILGIGVLLLSFKGLVDSGFYQAMTLYEHGLGPDPNVGSFLWAARRPAVFCAIIPWVRIRKDFVAPLRLDPRVLIW